MVKNAVKFKDWKSQKVTTLFNFVLYFFPKVFLNFQHDLLFYFTSYSYARMKIVDLSFLA